MTTVACSSASFEIRLQIDGEYALDAAQAQRAIENEYYKYDLAGLPRPNAHLDRLLVEFRLTYPGETSSQKSVYEISVFTTTTVGSDPYPLAQRGTHLIEVLIHTPSLVAGQTVFVEPPIQVAAGSLVVTLDEAAAAVKLIAERNRTIAEGAGAVSVAAALVGKAGGGKVACIVSGGNIDPRVLATILTGHTP